MCYRTTQHALKHMHNALFLYALKCIVMLKQSRIIKTLCRERIVPLLVYFAQHYKVL